jgi:hypothetical protein
LSSPSCPTAPALNTCLKDRRRHKHKHLLRHACGTGKDPDEEKDNTVKRRTDIQTDWQIDPDEEKDSTVKRQTDIQTDWQIDPDEKKDDTIK